MRKSLIIIPLLIMLLLLNGCTTCKKPYIKFGSECCLDRNDNLICDKDETAKEQQASKPSATISCNKPYIQVGSSCCLDQNDNSICDKDENQGTVEMQIVTEEISDVQALCVTDVAFDIKSVCKSGNDYKILIQNEGREPITSWQIRVFQDENTRKTFRKTVPIPASGTATVTITAADITGLTEVQLIEAIPVITRSNQDVICAQNINGWGYPGETLITSPC